MTLDIGVHIYYKEQRGEVLNFNSDRSRCFILLYESKNVSGMPIQTWVSTDDVKIDLKFYRDEKINNILINPNS
jgi:phage pi2 protein 07